MSNVEKFANNFEYNNGIWINKTTSNLIQIAQSIVIDYHIIYNGINYMPLIKIHEKYMKNETNLYSLTPHEFSVCKQCFL